MIATAQDVAHAGADAGADAARAGADAVPEAGVAAARAGAAAHPPVTRGDHASDRERPAKWPDVASTGEFAAPVSHLGKSKCEANYSEQREGHRGEPTSGRLRHTQRKVSP